MFVTDRLAVHLTDAPVHGFVPELKHYTLRITLRVVLQFRSKTSNAVKNEVYRKSADVALTDGTCALLTGGRRYDGESDGAVHGGHHRIAGERRSSPQPAL